MYYTEHQKKCKVSFLIHFEITILIIDFIIDYINNDHDLSNTPIVYTNPVYPFVIECNTMFMG